MDWKGISEELRNWVATVSPVLIVWITSDRKRKKKRKD